DVRRNANRLGGSTDARGGSLVERTVLQALRTVKENVVVDHVLVEHANAAPDHHLAIVLWIPGKTDLGCEVEIRLLHSIARSWERIVHCLNRGEIAVGTSCVAVISDTDA